MRRRVVFHRRVEKKIKEKSLPCEQIAKCVRLLAEGQTEGYGLRMKRLKGIDLPVFEARVNDDVRLIFTKQPAYTYSQDGAKEKDHLIHQMVVWDVDHHDDALKAARRISYESLRQAEHLNLATFLHPEGVLEEMEINKLPEYPIVPISVVQSAMKTAKNVLPQYVRIHYRGEAWWMEQAILTEQESLYDAQEFLEIDLERIEEEIQHIAQSDEDFLLRLLPEQMKFVRMPGPLLLSGTVGSGKTTIMLYHLYRQARANPAGRYLVVTYSPTLTKLCWLLFEHLPGGKQLLQRVDILSYEDLLRRFFPFTNMVSYDERRRQFHEAYLEAIEKWRIDAVPKPLKPWRKAHKEFWNEEVLWAEYWDAVKGQLNWHTEKPMDKEAYVQGVEHKQQQEERAAIYEALQTWFLLRGEDELDLSRRLWEDGDSLAPQYDGIYIDEIQDLCEVQWMLLIRLVKYHAGIFLTGDPFQALRPSGFYWKRLVARLSQAVTVQQGSLQLNLRNSRQIAQFVQQEMQRVRDKYGLKEMPDYHVTALLEGLPPARLLLREAPQTFLQRIASWLDDQGVVLVWDESEKSQPYVQQLIQHGALVCTVEEAKGLEFDRVALYRIYSRLHDQMKQSTVLRQQAFSRLYVALTRARRGMIVLETENTFLPPSLSEADNGWWESWKSVQPVRVRSTEVFASLAQLARRKDHEGKYAEAAILYEKADDYAYAAWCYEKAQDDANAARCYERAGDYTRAAKCYEQVKNYANAAECYKQAGDM
ncbi:MAG: hypothetical protein ACP5RN_13695, partial [Armatimonadota bacterium]